MAIKSVPVAFSPSRAPRRSGAGKVELALEGMTVPKVNADELAPTVCGGDDGLSNTNQLVVAARPRARAGLGAGFAIEAGWIPPVAVSGVKANLIGASAGWTSNTFGVLVVELRAHGSFGTVKGSFTCTVAETQHQGSTCFGATPSNDSFQPAVYGGDVTLGAQFASGRAQPYLGAGYSHLAPRFDVNYITASGQLDDSRVESNLDRATLFGGFLFHLAPAWSITGQFYTALKDAATVSFTLRAAL